MRIVLCCCIVLGLVIVGFGVQLVLDPAWQVRSFSAPAPAAVLNKQVVRHERRNQRGKIEIVYQPVVEFRYQVQGHQFTSTTVFPVVQSDVNVSPNEGRLYWELLERFQPGDETTAWYRPEDPAEACLIRRPSFLPYGLILLPVMVVSGLVAVFWSASARRKGAGIAAVWHVVGLAGAAHYFILAGADYAGTALVMFGLYTQIGLVPVACALPPSETSELTRRIKGAVWFSLVGSFVGVWLGVLAGKLAVWTTDLRVVRGYWLGYGMAITAALFALFGLFGRWQVLPVEDEVEAGPTGGEA